MKLSFVSVLLTTSALCFFSCHKKDDEIKTPEVINTELSDGFTDSRKSINGYLYSCLQANQYSSASINYNMIGFATFSDPAKNLMGNFNHYNNINSISSSTNAGNIDVGDVYLATSFQKFSQGNFQLSYQQNLSSQNAFSPNPYWLTEGNGSFKPLNITIPKGYPVLNYNTVSISNISKSTDFTINFGNNISNYDSLIIILQDGMTSSGNKKKILAKGSQSVTFSAQELSYFSASNYGKLSFYAYNYSNITVNSKVNVFELGNQYIINSITIVN